MPLQSVTAAELPTVLDMVNLAYRGPVGGREWASETSYITGERMSLDLLRADLENPGAELLIWTDEPGGSMLGCVWLEPAGALPSSSEAIGQELTWYLGMLTVHPDAQERGLGGVILKAAEDRAAKLGAKRVRMTVVNVREGLIAWYQRKGYTLTGETLPFPYDDERFGKPGRPDLSFVVLERALG